MEGASQDAMDRFRRAVQILNDAKLDFDPPIEWAPESDLELNEDEIH